MENKLIPMVDFVLEQRKRAFYGQIEASETLTIIDNYADFLKKPLTLGMFVPVDKHGVILQPIQFCCSGHECGCMGMPVNVGSQEEIDEYYEAKERVLFKGFEPFNQSTGNPDVINRELGIMICFNRIISIMIESSNGYGGFSDSEITIEQLADYKLELTESALKKIGLNP